MIMKKDVNLNIRLQPGAKRDEFCGWMEDGTLKVRVRGKPMEGQANDALIFFLSKNLGVPKSGIYIAAGEKSRNKRIRLEGISEETIRERIQTLLDQAP